MAARKRFAVCLRNEGYEASLEKRKIYEVLSDLEAERHDQLRVVDESGEDYLYPESFFAEIELSQPLRRALSASV